LSGGEALSVEDEEALNETLAQLLLVLDELDDRIGPMLEQDGRHFNRRWVAEEKGVGVGGGAS
jgi:hypothetical protein